MFADVPSGVVTLTDTVPTDPDGVVAVIDVLLMTVKVVAWVSPNVTAVAPIKPIPMIDSTFPPVDEPWAGLFCVPLLTMVTIGKVV